MTFEEAEKYVNELKWQYAKTYPQCPHEYTCLSWKPEDKAKMVEFAYFIRDNGYTERWGRFSSRVLNIGEMKYWTMDFPLEKTDLINRAYIDNKFRSQLSEFVKSADFQYVRGMSLSDIKAKMEERGNEQPELDKYIDLFGGVYEDNICHNFSFR